MQFRCQCLPDFFGPFCSSQFDDCTDGNVKCVHGICVDNPRDDPSTPKYSCICNVSAALHYVDSDH